MKLPAATILVSRSARLRPSVRVAAGAALLAVLFTLSACGDRKGTTTAFVPEDTTNADFTQLTIRTGDRPIGLATADFNGDGLTDFAVSNYLDGTVSIYTALGNGNFSAQTVAIGDHPTQILFADLDGGGPDQLDLAILSETEQRHSVSIVLNDGAQFTFAESLDTDTVIDQMSVACMQSPCANGSAEDVVVTLTSDKVVRVYVNDGSGGFTPHDAGTGENTGQFAIADFNGDGIQDLAVALPAVNKLTLFLGYGTGDLLNLATYDTDRTPTQLVAAPLRSGGIIDLAVSCRDGDRVDTFFGDGSGAFVASAHTNVPKSPERLIVSQISGVADIAVVNRGQEVISYLLGDGTGTFTAFDLPSTRDPFDLVAGDFTGDANPDLAVVELDKRVLGIFRGDGVGGLVRTQIGFESTVTQPRRVKMCGGTKDDLLLLQTNSDRVLLLCNVH